MEKYSVIIRPLVTEQSTHLANVKGAYSFEINPKANKTEVKQAIENTYNVKVRKVRTANRLGKIRRKGRVFGRKTCWKKAIVYLEKEYHIDLF
jgi:large subunit ribosomal protein L23